MRREWLQKVPTTTPWRVRVRPNNFRWAGTSSLQYFSPPRPRDPRKLPRLPTGWLFDPGGRFWLLCLTGEILSFVCRLCMTVTVTFAVFFFFSGEFNYVIVTVLVRGQKNTYIFSTWTFWPTPNPHFGPEKKVDVPHFLGKNAKRGPTWTSSGGFWGVKKGPQTGHFRPQKV